MNTVATQTCRLSDQDIGSRAEGQLSLLFVELQELNESHPLVLSFFGDDENALQALLMKIWSDNENRDFVPGQDDHLLSEHYVSTFEKAIADERAK